MEKADLRQAISRLEDLLTEFREAKARGKETNSNEERAQSIADIEEITGRLETYLRNNEELLEQMTGTHIDLARNIAWNDVVRPTHFEEDLQREIINLKEQVS